MKPNTMRRFALLAAASLATVAGALLLWEFRSVLVMLAAALALAATVRPPALRLTRIGLPRPLATVVLVLLVLVGTLAFVGFSAYVLAEDLPRAVTDLAARYAGLRVQLAAGPTWQQGVAAQMPPAESFEDLVARLQAAADPVAGEQADPATEALTGAPPQAAAPTPAPPAPVATPPATGAENQAETDPAAAAAAAQERTERRASGLLRALFGTTAGLAGVLTQFIIVVFLGLYWALENEWFERLWISLLAPEQRPRARRTWHAVEDAVGTHIRSELVQSVIAFFLLWLGFRAMGIHYPLLLAWLCALAWLVPLVGWLIALLPVLLIGLLSGPAITIGAAALMTAIFVLMEFVVEPRLDTRRRAGSVLGLVVALVLLELLGIVGLLIASPVAVALNAFFSTAFAITPEAAPAPPKSANLEELQGRLAQLRAAMGRTEGEIPQRTRSLYERLQELVLKAEQSL